MRTAVGVLQVLFFLLWWDQLSSTKRLWTARRTPRLSGRDMVRVQRCLHGLAEIYLQCVSTFSAPFNVFEHLNVFTLPPYQINVFCVHMDLIYRHRLV